MDVTGWFAVQVATIGPVAVFKEESHARDYANSLRDAIDEARGGPSAISVKQV